MATWALLAYIPFGFLYTNQGLWAQKFSEPWREMQFVFLWVELDVKVFV